MQKLEIILVGSTGKMGQEICAILTKHNRAKLMMDGQKGKLSDLNVPKNRIPRAVIDFSSPEGFVEALRFCIKNKIPFVSGTTGLTAKHFSLLRQASRKIPVLWAPNMSLGINLFLNLIEKVGATFTGFDMQIEESHHKHKIDSPSGTAIALQNKMQQTTKKKLPAIHSTRAGGVIGQHKLSIFGEDEVLTIEHQALNRRMFARGAIEAALWVVNKKPKLYEMKEFINDR